jgi:hypothetical protein
MNYYLVDCEGSLIEVTDLKEAIFQVAAYLRYEIENPTKEQIEFHKKRLKYWKDIYNKLVRLKQAAEKAEISIHH